MYLSIIIPVFNEEKNLIALWERLLAALKNSPYAVEVVFVDDGSTDGSLALLRSFKEQATRCPVVSVVELARNFGQHPAIIAGFSVAKGCVLATCDADLQTDPEDIQKLVSKLDTGYDFVSGIRQARSDSLLLRRLPSFLFTRLLNIVTGKKLRDYGCPLNVLRRQIAESMRDYGEMQRFLKPLAVKLAGRTAEVEITHHPRLAGRSRYGLLNLVDLFFDFLTNFSRHLFQRVAIVGGILSILCLAAGILYLLLRFPLGVIEQALDRLQVIILIGFLSGTQLLVLGTLGDFVIRIYRRMDPKPLFKIRKIY